MEARLQLTGIDAEITPHDGEGVGAPVAPRIAGEPLEATPLIEALNVEDVRQDVAGAYAAPVIDLDPPPLTLVTSKAPDIKTGEAEQAKSPSFKIRTATYEDIDDIVDVDLRSFDSVYSAYDVDSEELRAELKEKFKGRLDKVGGEWMPVLEREGKIVGFMTCCPTNKTPEAFESWEETTDNGTLDTTYDPNGENLYVVTLSVLPEGSQGKDMLFANQIGKMLKAGHKLGYFESRLPGLRDWVVENKLGGEQGIDPSELDEDTKQAYAEEYFGLTTEVKGREVRYDRLIRLYERIGCKCIKLAANAYQDEPSLDFGVVCVYDGSSLFDGSDIPFRLPENRTTRWLMGTAMTGISRSLGLTRKILN